jgi:hypothetical protein
VTCSDRPSDRPDTRTLSWTPALAGAAGLALTGFTPAGFFACFVEDFLAGSAAAFVVAALLEALTTVLATLFAAFLPVALAGSLATVVACSRLFALTDFGLDVLDFETADLELAGVATRGLPCDPPRCAVIVVSLDIEKPRNRLHQTHQSTAGERAACEASFNQTLPQRQSGRDIASSLLTWRDCFQ